MNGLATTLNTLIEKGLVAFTEETISDREFSQRLMKNPNQPPRSYGKGDILDIFVGERRRMSRKDAQLVLDALVERGDIVAERGSRIRSLGFSSYNVNTNSERYVLKSVYDEMVERTQKNERNKRRDEILAEAKAKVIDRHRDEVDNLYTYVCQDLGLDPRRED